MLQAITIFNLLLVSPSVWAFSATGRTSIYMPKTQRLLACPSDENGNSSKDCGQPTTDRRAFVTSGAAAVAVAFFSEAAVADSENPEGMDVNSFLRKGQVQNPMGVSGQAGKSKPQTGIIFREGSDVLRNAKTGEVSAEILLGPQSNPVAVLTSFSSPWQLATGTVFDVECRDASTGDGAFLSLSGLTKGKSISELPASFFLERIFGSSGRFSFYGTPTDIKVKKSRTEGQYRFIDISFSTLSQSTQTEIPRNAVVVATIPEGTEQAVMMVGSSTATRWRKGSEDIIRKTAESFRAVAAPKSGLKVRAKQKGDDLFD